MTSRISRDYLAQALRNSTVCEVVTICVGRKPACDKGGAVLSGQWMVESAACPTRVPTVGNSASAYRVPIGHKVYRVRSSHASPCPATATTPPPTAAMSGPCTWASAASTTSVGAITHGNPRPTSSSSPPRTGPAKSSLPVSDPVSPRRSAPSCASAQSLNHAMSDGPCRCISTCFGCGPRKCAADGIALHVIQRIPGVRGSGPWQTWMTHPGAVSANGGDNG